MIDFRCMDCMDFMAQCPDKAFDLAIVDPPYFSGPERRGYYGRKEEKNGVKRFYEKSEYWTIPDEKYFAELMRVSKHYIVWGCNYFDWNFAPGRIVWDKCNGDSFFSDAEIAATDLINMVKLFPFMWNGMFQGKSISEGRTQQANKSLNEKRIHPTQKPIALYTYQLQTFAKKGWTILDTHVGSASSLIACHRLGFDAVGCEIDRKRYDAARKRLGDEMNQCSMFDAAPAQLSF